MKHVDQSFSPSILKFSPDCLEAVGSKYPLIIIRINYGIQ